LNTNKAYRELRAWAVRHGLMIEVSLVQPRYKREAHIVRPTAHSWKPFTELDFGHEVRAKINFQKEQARAEKVRARKLKPLFK